MPRNGLWSKRKWPGSSNASQVSSTTSRGTSSSQGSRYRPRKFYPRRRTREPRSSTPGASTQPGASDLAASLPGPSPGLASTRDAPPRETPVRRTDEEDDWLVETVLALDVRGGAGGSSNMGACYYVAAEEKMYFLIDVLGGGLDAVETVRLHAQPTVILISSRVDESVDAILDPRKSSEDATLDEQAESAPLPYIIDVRPSSEFDPVRGKQSLVQLQSPIFADSSINLVVPGYEDPYESYVHGLDPGMTGRQGKMLALSRLVDFESPLAMGCAGALLAYLQRRRAVMFLPGDCEAQTCMQVSRIEMTALKGYMFVNNNTLAALQIVPQQSHPSAQNRGANDGSSKEDLSVYGLFHHLARTPQGRVLLRRYFLRPSIDLDVIHERHASITTFLRPDNEGVMKEMVKNLNQIKNMRFAMLQLQKGMSSVTKGSGIKNGFWMTLRSFAFYALAIRTAFAQVVGCQKLAIYDKVLTTFQIDELARIGRIVTQIVDFPQSQLNHRTVVNAGVDPELDSLKHTFNGLEDLLGNSSRSIAATIPQHYAVELTVVFLPQIGFLICLPMDPETRRATWEGGPGDEAWERIFSTDGFVYYKDFRMRELDEHLGDLHAAVCDKEIEIIHELAQRVLHHEAMLCAVSDVCGELDALLALAQGARLYKLTRPRMTTDNIIDIVEGRHILQEQTGSPCIPNDTLLIGGEGDEAPCPTPQRAEVSSMPPPPRPSVPREGPSMRILTGPNYSGKSMYLKHVALIVYLAHVGSFVPATRATIGLTDRILTRIATRESVTRPQSAFAIDLQQVSTALRTATPRSLLLLDEFGKGTTAADGAGLLWGALQHLLARARHSHIKVLVATHFHELFEPTLQMQMQGQLQHRNNTDPCTDVDPHHPHQHISCTDNFQNIPGLEFAHMQVLIDEEAQSAGDQVTYLYKLQPGRSLKSLGIICAALNGINAAVIQRAEDLSVLEANGGDLIAACARADDDADEHEEQQRAAHAEHVARMFLAMDLEGENMQIAVEDSGQSERRGMCRWRTMLDRLV